MDLVPVLPPDDAGVATWMDLVLVSDVPNIDRVLQDSLQVTSRVAKDLTLRFAGSARACSHPQPIGLLLQSAKTLRFEEQREDLADLRSFGGFDDQLSILRTIP